jgi:cell division protein FtsB
MFGSIVILKFVFSYKEKLKNDLTLKEGDIRMEHLESNFPTLKNVRDNLLHQYQVVNEDLKKMSALWHQMESSSSKEMITQKIQSLSAEQRKLKQQIQTLDAEVERGVVLKSFDNIEAGGIKKFHTQEINNEYVKDLSRATHVNNVLQTHLK